MTEEQVNVEPPKVDCAITSSEKPALAAAAGFLIIKFNFLESKCWKNHLEQIDSDLERHLRPKSSRSTAHLRLPRQ